MLSLTSEYALRAMVHLVQHQAEWPIAGKRIAEATGIPSKYLSKILGDLVRQGVLTATRGKGGGFRLARSARAVRLSEILDSFEQPVARRCPFGNNECSDEDPCNAHDQWKRVLSTYRRFLMRTSLASVSGGRRKAGKRRARRKA